MKYILLILSFCFFSCAANDLPQEQPEFASKYEICNLGCKYLKTLKDSDGQDGCKESRNVGDLTCPQYCARQIVSGNKNINPKCWTTLSSCSDFEEICNMGELYP